MSGEKVSREKAEEVPTIAGAVGIISRTAANVPIKLYKRDGEKVVEVKNDKRVQLLNHETGDTLDAKQMKQAMFRDYYLGRGGYCFVNKNGIQVESLHYVSCDDISVVKNTDVIFKDYAILVQGRSYYPHQFIKLLRNSTDGAEGKSIVDQNERVISVAYNSLKYEEVLVKTGGNKKGFVKSQKKLTQEAIDKLRKAWSRLYQNNSENVVILNDGLEFQEASNTSVEMQLNENKKTNGEEICKIFNIPPSMMNGTAKEDDDKHMVKYCITNLLEEFTTALDKVLLLESEKDTYFFAADMYELTKGDIDKRYAAYKTASETGWLQIDEIRKKENFEPLGLNMVKLGLQDVLYDPDKGLIYIPNTNQTYKIGGENKGQESNLEVNQ